MSKIMDELYDVIVIGGGPAGLTAALYLARAKYRVLVVEKDHFGGQITITSQVVNYPGVEKTSGEELTNTMQKQAEKFGAEFLLANVESIDIDKDIKRVVTNRGIKQAFGILIATGAHPRTIGFKGEEEFKGRGVAYCATCDGEFFTGKEVFVIGGGFAAAEESVFLTKYAKHVTILMITDDFTCAKTTADEAKNNEKISIRYNTAVEEVLGNSLVDYIRYKDLNTNEVFEYRSNHGDNLGVFVFAGYEPASDLVKDKLELNEEGYIITDKNQQTSALGVYAAGDICIKPLRQVVTAVGDGALAATELEKYVSQMHIKTGISTKVRQVQTITENDDKIESSIFSQDIIMQLKPVFDKMDNNLILKLSLDNSDVSNELKEYISQLVNLSDKLSMEEINIDDDKPCVYVYNQNNSYTGIAFHGVPGGHEFTSFVLGLYNASGKGQQIDEQITNEIKLIHKKINMKVFVSLSCTKCPELVTSAQKIASLNENITAEVYDLNHFPDIQKKYNVMSVPCMVINDENVTFGKKNINEILDYINEI